MKFETEFLVPGDLIWLPEGVGLIKVRASRPFFNILKKPTIGIFLKRSFNLRSVESLVFCLGEKWMVSSNKIRLYQPKKWRGKW